jgi:hypothetical protein
MLTASCDRPEVKEANMSKVEVNYDAFAFNKYFWLGRHDVPWLDNNVGFLVDTEEDAIPRVQRDIIEFVCNSPLETRSTLENCLFAEYQPRIYGSFMGGDEVTPPVKRPVEIWDLIREPGVSIPPEDRIAPDCYFVVSFECVWDPEHGLSILFNDRGEPIDVGGQGDYF